MSLATDSPVHSSSSDDFASFLDETLDSDSSPSPPERESDDVDVVDEEGDADVPTTRAPKRFKVGTVQIQDEASTSTSLGEASASTLLGSPEKKNEKSANKNTLSNQILCATHPGSINGLCIVCGYKVEESGVNLSYIHKGLRLNNDEIFRLRSTDRKNLIRHKKLYLVLDLDHTLLNSTQLVHLTENEGYLKGQAASSQGVVDGSLFMLNNMHMMTKLRPYVRNFLKEAHKLFELSVYTMGDRPYALAMSDLLDPKGEYFGDRIISRDDGTQRNKKGLDIVLGVESAVLILDDSENAWPDCKENLILMERYHFFRSSCHQFGFDCESLSELKSDESEPEGALMTVLEVLKQVHNMYFNEPGEDSVDRDVRQVLKSVRKEILKGCNIVFSHVFPMSYQAENHHLWKMAEQLGAVCSKKIDSSVTHVVSRDGGTDKSRWAMREKKFLVHPRWIEAANYMWKKLPEEKFTVDIVKDQ